MINTVEELKQAITSLPDTEYTKLRNWFAERDWEKWEQKIEADSKSGKLDFLIEEALAEKSKDNLKDL